MKLKTSFDREFEEGINQFNQQEFFQCHETLEQLWNKQIGPKREFLQGIIQIAVAYHHLSNQNYVGANKLLQNGLRRLKQFEPTYLSIDVTALVNAVTYTLDELLRSGNEGKVTSLPTPKIRNLP